METRIPVRAETMSLNYLQRIAAAILSMAMLCTARPAKAAVPTTPLQKAAVKLQSDLEQALSESNFDALQRVTLQKDAAVLVDAANVRAHGHRPKRGPLRKAEKNLEKAFSSGLLKTDDAAQMNLDLADYKDAS